MIIIRADRLHHLLPIIGFSEHIGRLQQTDSDRDKQNEDTPKEVPCLLLSLNIHPHSPSLPEINTHHNQIHEEEDVPAADQFECTGSDASNVLELKQDRYRHIIGIKAVIKKISIQNSTRNDHDDKDGEPTDFFSKVKAYSQEEENRCDRIDQYKQCIMEIVDVKGKTDEKHDDGLDP